MRVLSSSAWAVQEAWTWTSQADKRPSFNMRQNYKRCLFDFEDQRGGGLCPRGFSPNSPGAKSWCQFPIL